MLKGMHYKITVFAGSKGLDQLNDNVDVEVAFDNGTRYSATFFTLQNIQSLMDSYERSGECMKGLFFWAAEMIIVRTLSRQNIAKVVAALIKTDEFENAFSQISPSSES